MVYAIAHLLLPDRTPEEQGFLDQMTEGLVLLIDATPTVIRYEVRPGEVRREEYEASLIEGDVRLKLSMTQVIDGVREQRTRSYTKFDLWCGQQGFAGKLSEFTPEGPLQRRFCTALESITIAVIEEACFQAGTFAP